MTEKAEGCVLVVDDNPTVIRSLHLFLKHKFSSLITETDPEQIPSRMKKSKPDVILLDMNFTAGDSSGKEGLKWLKRIISVDPDISVVFITAYGGIDLAVRAIREGATDFVMKPWDNQKLLSTLQTALSLRKSKQRIKNLRMKQAALASDIDREFQYLAGRSASMMKVSNAIRKVARTDANVLITGENGTGKELVAREIHRNSSRAGEVFLSIDLSTLSETLFESELFGHVKGAFTDAREDRTGKLQAASGGTLLLDEIGNLSLPLQSKLLTVLQNREIVPVGSNTPVPIDIRLLCATNKNLDHLLSNELLRSDLYFRINTIQIEVPPLREREEDVIDMAMHFLQVFSQKYNKPSLKFTSSAIDALHTYDWPGNVRELKHTVEKAVILSESDILDVELLNLQQKESAIPDPSSNLTLEDYEKEIIGRILRKHRGNISHTAGELNIGRQTLYRKIQKYGL
jgi:DNA-binding NtrC family response regulator